MITDEEFHRAWDRIARTGDGVLIYLHLQKRLMATAANETESALLMDHGERRFASQLIGLMAKGIEESGGSSGTPSDGGRQERPIVLTVRGPVAVKRHGSGRLIDPDQPVEGWDNPANDAAKRR